MTDPLTVYALLCASAFAAGVVNTLAGGGTLLTFPALLAVLTGTPDRETVANVTSTVSLLPGSLAGAVGYRRELVESRRWIIWLIGPSVIGGTIGSLLLIGTDNRIFAELVPWLILSAAVLFLLQPLLSRFLNRHAALDAPRHRGLLWLLVAFQSLISVYGGYFGAGIGILMLASLGLMGVGDIRHMNGIKNVLAAAINGTSVVVFMVSGKVIWSYALVMALAAIGGGVAGAYLGRTLPRSLVRGVVVLVGFALAAYFFLGR